MDLRKDSETYGKWYGVELTEENKKQFYISVTNATNQKKRLGSYYSLKGEGHGFGLYSIDRIIKERNGFLNRKDEPGVFSTEIMLPFMF